MMHGNYFLFAQFLALLVLKFQELKEKKLVTLKLMLLFLTAADKYDFFFSSSETRRRDHHRIQWSLANSYCEVSSVTVAVKL